jgi:eukaryotic-like serine/threonine-protein kinase
MQTIVDTSNPISQTVVEALEIRIVAGRYRCTRLLGTGGMGDVYLAEDLVLARRVALKTVRSALCGNEEARRRILRECRMQAAIGAHPNIITLYDTVEEDEHIYLVMEYFAGDTLASLLAVRAESGAISLSLEERVRIVLQILAALTAIHATDIVHRDIKTSNILLRKLEDGRYEVKLMDFGIARIENEEDDTDILTRVGIRGPGTPAYMAPERIDPQAFGEISPATDLYSVGVILHELLRGEPPFKGSATKIFTAHLSQQPDLSWFSPQLPFRLREVLRRALEKKPDDRYRDARIFALDLEVAAFGDGAEGETLRPAGPEATLLAVDEGEGLAAPPPEATVLAPIFEKDAVRSAGPGKVAVAAVVLVCLLVVFLGLLRLARVNGPDESDTVAKVVLEVPVSKAEPSLPNDSHGSREEISALETLEKARKGGLEGALLPERAEGANRAASQWQVLESHSRKIQ